MDAKEKQTQKERVITHIRKHGSLTRLESVEVLGIFELAARINDLEKMGYRFKKETIAFKTKTGATGHCKRYTLMEVC